jgi:hypothetical protein
MATTSLTFGTGNTLLGLDVSSAGAPIAGTRAQFRAFPTVSYTGSATATSYTAQVFMTKVGSLPTPNSVIYLTSTAGGTVSTGVGTTTATSFGPNINVTFTTTSNTALMNFLQGIYLGDNSATNVSDDFQLTLRVKDNTANQGTITEVYNIACYLRGTGVATAEGEVAVEDLRIGDLLRTVDGGLKPVKFIGTQSFEAEFIAATPAQRPVLIRKDAIGEGLPARDLYVSPMHSLYLDDVLVPAVALENGVSILRADAPEGVEYFHIELDRHDVILAEGLPAESFIDDDSRAVFDNAFEYEALYGEGERIARFAPRIEEGYAVEAMRRRIAARAGVQAPDAVPPVSTIGHVERLADGVLTGWVMNQAAPDAAVELDVLVDGEVVGRGIANRYRTDLDHAGLAGGRCGFTMALPNSAASLEQVQVRIAATGAALRNAAPVAAAA